jgi:hypothetical protein
MDYYLFKTYKGFPQTSADPCLRAEALRQAGARNKKFINSND